MTYVTLAQKIIEAVRRTQPLRFVAGGAIGITFGDLLTSLGQSGSSCAAAAAANKPFRCEVNAARATTQAGAVRVVSGEMPK